MQKYDGDRLEESRFNQYWQANLKEITTKHI
jgi:cephalosporin-C deacetylase-like acetyl esterase